MDPVSVYLFALARFAFRRRRLVLGVWLAIAIGAIVLATASGGKTNDNFTIPGTESQQVSDLLAKKVPALSGGQTQIVFATSGAAKVTDSSAEAAIESSLAKLK